MFDRDKKALRNMGVQLEVRNNDAFEEGESARYLISRGAFVWPAEFELNPKQLGLVELAARSWNTQIFGSAARSGLTRLKSRGMVEIDRQLQHISPRLVAKHESFGPLADAISASTTVVFEYRKSDGIQSVREVEPLKLRLIEGEWVLLAREREAVKNFLLRRIVSKVRDTEALFSPPSEAVITRAEQDLVAFAASKVAVIEIVPDSEAWWHFGSEREQVELNYMDEALMAEDLMEFGADLKVISPKSLADRIRAGFEAVIASHA
jgi:predicted DNA-binding transcriptional regulator YafY